MVDKLKYASTKRYLIQTDMGAKDHRQKSINFFYFPEFRAILSSLAERLFATFLNLFVYKKSTLGF